MPLNIKSLGIMATSERRKERLNIGVLKGCNSVGE